MKKVLFISIMCLFLIGCKRYPPAEDFFDYEKVGGSLTHRVYVEKHTDVLYYCESKGYSRIFTPILKKDGLPLTYSEYKSSKKLD